MFKNVASQKITVYAYTAATGLPLAGDAANLTAYVSKDDGTLTVLADTSATEVDATNGKGYYIFDLAQAETNADKLLFTCVSTTSGVVVKGCPDVVYTFPTTGILAPTVAARTLDVSTGGEAGLDWANIGSKTTTNNLTATTIKDLSATGLNNVVMTDLSAVPAIDASVVAAINWMYDLMRNKRTETATVETLFANDGTTAVATSTKSDSAGTFTRGVYS